MTPQTATGKASAYQSAGQASVLGHNREARNVSAPEKRNEFESMNQACSQPEAADVHQEHANS
jgi:hypothetical protein